MSNLDLAAETQQQQQKGLDSFLSQEERSVLQRMLGFPEDIPDVFKSWLIDFMAVNIPQIPISQIVGFSQFTAIPSSVGQVDSTTSTAYVDLANVGPMISGLSDGKYIFIYSCVIRKGALNGGGRASISINGSNPSDDDSIQLKDLNAIEQDTTVSRAVHKTLSGGGNNIVKMKYRTFAGLSTVTFYNRSLVSLRYGN